MDYVTSIHLEKLQFFLFKNFRDSQFFYVESKPYDYLVMKNNKFSIIFDYNNEEILFSNNYDFFAVISFKKALLLKMYLIDQFLYS